MSIGDYFRVSGNRSPDNPFPKEYSVFGRRLRDAQVPDDELSEVDPSHFLSEVDLEATLDPERHELVLDVVKAVLRKQPVNEPEIENYLEGDYELQVREEMEDILFVFSRTGKMSYEDGLGYSANI